ncbi:small ribosomal subunit protein mS37-like [Saccostrea echinata]|uniref:small ribosomal subunit protein mS37-like n=1 Tax=Saccostrea echinata TaxID=191078 RepID=UPI002A83CB8F|nr:small ribosomal subunit protein mS37-like [Saccostrea echinata]
MPFLTQVLAKRPSPFWKKGQLPRAPKARIAGVPALRNKIANKDITGFDGHCNTELQNMLACLKKAAYNESPCEAEILSYNSCMKKAIAYERVVKANKFVIKPIKGSDGREKFPPTVINKVLSRFPMKYRNIKIE